jgi:hypothetical protein
MDLNAAPTGTAQWLRPDASRRERLLMERHGRALLNPLIVELLNALLVWRLPRPTPPRLRKINRILQMVVPELQRRGVFRKDFEERDFQRVNRT